MNQIKHRIKSVLGILALVLALGALVACGEIPESPTAIAQEQDGVMVTHSATISKVAASLDFTESIDVFPVEDIDHPFVSAWLSLHQTIRLGSTHMLLVYKHSREPLPPRREGGALGWGLTQMRQPDCKIENAWDMGGFRMAREFKRFGECMQGQAIEECGSSISADFTARYAYRNEFEEFSHIPDADMTSEDIWFVGWVDCRP